MILQPKGSCVINYIRQTILLFIVKDDTIIFSPEYTKSLNFNLISHYKKCIFSNYKLGEYLFDVYESKNFKNLLYFGCKFNQSVNNLPNTLTHLTFGKNFNQYVNNLSNTLSSSSSSNNILDI